MFKLLEKNIAPLLFAVLCVIFYSFFAYDLVRNDFIKLITLFGGLFIVCHQLIKVYGWNFKLLTGFGLLFRLVFIAAIPNLSQDFYRFIWDGQVISQGFSPYLVSPKTYMESPDAFGFVIHQAEALSSAMGMPSVANFTNYPPINQLLFSIGALVGVKSILGNVIVLRVFIILADVGILFFGKKLLEQLNLPIKNIFWYFLNPFIIIELTGNLHFEGVMMFFFVLALYFLFKRKHFLAAIFLGFSISTKLIPLMFLPLFFFWFLQKNAISSGLKKLTVFYVTVIGTVLLTFLPFISTKFINNYLATNALWFQNFEFNASIYYIIRWVGFQVVGWNIIGTVGKILPLFVIAFIVFFSFFRKNNDFKKLTTSMLFCISFYFLLSTTIHPWYIATPLVLGLFTNYKFPIIWSVAVMLSYVAYKNPVVEENYWLIALEYVVVIGFAIWELFFKTKNLKNLSYK